MRQSGRGSFITLEGGEGAGKSTQLNIIVAKLRALQIEALATREPGGSPGAETLREILLSGTLKHLGPKAEAILFSAARIDHLDALIEPALSRGTWVVCDRFLDSTRAYQGSMGKLDPRFLNALERVTLGDLLPDLTLILDLPAEMGLARAKARRGAAVTADRFEQEDLSFHQALRAAFLSIAQEEPERCVVIDATRSLEEVSESIWSTISDRLLPRLRLVEPSGEGAGGSGYGA
jgi:dTMP kinase